VHFRSRRASSLRTARGSSESAGCCKRGGGIKCGAESRLRDPDLRALSDPRYVKRSEL